MKTSSLSHFERMTAHFRMILVAASVLGVCITPSRADLLAHWTFDESGGTVAHDRANGLNGTLSPTGASFVPGGISSNAISISRVANGFVNMGNVLSLTSNDFSLVAWVKMNPGDVTPDTIVLGKHESGYVNGYFLMVNQGGGGGQDNKAVFYAGGLVGGPVSQTSVNDGAWHQVVGVYRFGVNKAIYVDGVAQATNIAPGINGNAAAFVIGGLSASGTPAGRFTGWVDEVQVYGHALSADEVHSLYQNPGKSLPINPCAPQPAGLVSWWPGEGSASDIVGTNNGSFVSPSYAAGKVGQALNFDGAGNHVRVPASPTLDVGTGAGLTIEAWINPANLTTAGPIVEWALNGAYAVHFYANTLSSGRLYANLVGVAGDEHTIQTPTSVLSANTYQHVALTYDKASGVARLFRNGVNVQESNVGTIGTLRTSSDFYIGHRPAISPGGAISFLGQIDEASLYSRALSLAELQAIYAAGGAGKCGSVLAQSPSTNDLWDISQGVTVVAHSSFDAAPGGPNPYDARDLFGGLFSNYAPERDMWGGVVFDDEVPADHIHYVEWRTPTPVTVQSFNLFAQGDYPGQFAREFASFALKAKSAGSSIYDLTLYAFTPPHPYSPDGRLVLSANIQTVTAQDFRAEFVNLPGQVFSGPRVVELDGFGGPVPPFITLQPQNQTLVAGETATFSVTAAGTPPLSYQWRWNGTNLNGATASSLTLANVQYADAGVYSVVISNSAGTATSSNAVLTVNPPLSPSTNDLWDISQGVTVVAHSSFDAALGGPNPYDARDLFGGLFSNYAPERDMWGGVVFDDEVPADHIHYVEWRTPTPVTVQSFNLFAQSDSLGQREFASFTLKAKSAGSPVFDLTLYTFTPPHPYSADGRLVLSTSIQTITAQDFRAEFANLPQTYPGPRVVELDGFGEPVPAFITSHPVDRVATVGDSVTFNVVAVGTLPLAYQWRLYGTNLNGATGSSLTLNNVQLPDAGLYSVAVSNSAGWMLSSNALLTVNPPPPCAAPPAGLVSWWTGNGNANDNVGGNNGTFVGASFAGGQVGQAFHFDGSGNHVRVPASSSLNVGAGDGLSVEAWIYLNDLTSVGPIVEWAVSGQYAVLLFANSLNPGQLYASLFDGQGRIIQSAGSVLTPNVWQHVGLTYDKTTGLSRLFLNGVMIQEAALGSFTPRTAADLYIGYRPPSTPFGPISFNGKIDEVSVYSRALAPAEIQAIYNAGSSGKCVVPTAPFIFAQPQNLLVAEGANVTFSVAAGGTPPLSYQWSLNGSPVANATNASLNLTGVTTNQAGTYAVLVTNLQGSALSSNATLTVRVLGPNLFDDFDPEIDTMQWAGFGGTVRATNYGGFVSASNSLWFGGSGSRFATTRSLNTANGALIQFYLRLANGNPPLWERVDLPTKGIVLEYSTNGVNWTQLGRYDTTNYYNWTSVSLVIPSGAQATNTQFRWRQLLNSGSISDHWALDNVAVTTGPVAPFITSQPQQQTVIVGGTATYNVVAGGTMPLSYQWRFNETNLIAGATTNSLVLTNVQLAAAGAYSVVVSNAAGTATSSNVVLTVNLPPALVAVTSVNAESPAALTMPLMLTANGNENAVGFSLNFDPVKLSYTGVTLGSGAATATLLVNTNELATGKLGIALALPTDTVFAAGAQEILRVGFTTAIVTTPTVANVSFGDVPISRLVSGTAGNVLASTFTGGTVSIAAANYEGDVTPRPDGDRVANITDWVLAGRYVARLDYPTNAAEFQRADCAPRATLGDGLITVIDWVQAGRYAAALDPLTPVGGPSVESPGGAAANGPVQAAGGDREVSVTNGMLLPSQTATVGVQLKAQGDENALGFSVSYDPTKLTYAGTTLGSGAAGATLIVNAGHAGSGKLGFLLALGTGNSFAAGSHEVVKLNFTAATTTTCDAVIALTDEVVKREVSSSGASTLPASYVNGTVAVNPLPVLGLVRVNENIRLTWPLWASNYVMQASGSLAPGGWTNLPVSVVASNGQHEVTLPLGPADAFYRLKR